MTKFLLSRQEMQQLLGRFKSMLILLIFTVKNKASFL